MNKLIKNKIILGLIATVAFHPQESNAADLPVADTSIALEIEDTNAPEVNVKQKKELTPEEMKEAEKLQKKAVDIYSNLLTYNSEARGKAIEENVTFLKKKLEDTKKAYNTEIKNQKSLDEEVINRKKQIDKLRMSSELKDKRLVELKDYYEQRKDYMTYHITTLKKRIKTLEERLATYSNEKIDVDAINKEKGVKKKLTWEEKDKLKKKEADKVFSTIEDNLILKRYNELNK